MRVSIALHIIGLAFWLGGMAVLTRFMQVLTVEGAASPQLDGFRALTKRSWYGFVIGGLVVSTATGLYQFLSVGASFYMKQGWFHGKLTLILLLYVITWYVGKEVYKANNGSVLQKRRLIMLHGVTSLALVLIVFLTIIGRSA